MNLNEFGTQSFVRVKGLKERIIEAEKENQMREIKFRQAITEKDGTFRWRYWGYLHTDTFGLPVFINPLGSVEWDKRPSYQFTSLKDKNGREIYEGDCFRTSDKHSYSSNCIVEILFIEGAFVAQLHRKDLMEVDAELIPHFKQDFPDSFKVIGNIHQNPELMEQKNG